MTCKYGFYTCEFIGKSDFCNNCQEGQNYQMKEEKKPRGAPKKENPLVNKTFRIDGESFKAAKANHPRTLNKKVNQFIKRLAKKKKI